jgi:hypothetical protein
MSRIKKIGKEDESEKEFVMPNAFCGCSKKLSLYPLTLYVVCGWCGRINQIIRKDGNYIVKPYTSKKKLRPTLISKEAPEEQSEIPNKPTKNANSHKTLKEGTKFLGTGTKI